MNARVAAPLLAMLGWLAACNNGNGPPLPRASQLRVLHTIRGAPTVVVYVDGGRGDTIAFGELGRTLPLSPGEHDLALTLPPADTTHTLLTLFSTMEGVNYDVFLIESLSGGNVVIDEAFVEDTAAVPAGHVRLRVADFAKAAPAIDAYRTEPDSTGLLASAQPLGYQAVTRYFDGPPGDWTLVISHAGTTDTLLATGPIPLTDGQARTVVVLDSTAGRVSWRVVPDRN